MTLPISPETPWLAPLAGFSDLPFRILCREFGCSVTCTEMISAKGLIYGSPGTAELVKTNDKDTPVVGQIFGSDPDFIQRGAACLLEKGFSYVDLNAGCPVRKVVKSGSGAALLKEPDLLVRLAKILVTTCGPGRVGIKMRLGWSEEAMEYLEIGRRLEQEGAAWITLHPRTAKQGFSGNADWSHLNVLQQALAVPVIGSGDLFTAQDGIRCLEQTRIKGIMFARGALRDPFIFKKFHQLSRKEHPAAATPAELSALIKRHAELISQYGDKEKALLRMRTIIPRYIRSLHSARRLRQAFSLCSSWQEFDDLTREVASLPADVHHTT